MTQTVDTHSPSQICADIQRVFIKLSNISILLKRANRPLKWFDDGVQVGRFFRDGNEESKLVVSPWQCMVGHLNALKCWFCIVNQQITLL
jgi:hypothetical protein